MKKMKKFSALLLTAAMTLSMAACGNSSAGTSTTEAASNASENTAETQTDTASSEAAESTASNGDLEDFSIVLDWYPNAVHSFIYTAIEKGYYAEEGLNVHVQFPANTKDAITMTAAGQADAGLYYQPNIISTATNQDVPVRIIGTIVQHPLNIVMSMKSSNITCAKDLKGKIIGYPGTVDNEYFVKAMMEHNGLSYDDVTMQDVGFDLNTSLISGNVDAVIGTYINHEYPALQKEGYDVTYFDITKEGCPDYEELVLVTGENQVKNESDKLARFIRASRKGFQDVLDDPQGCLQILLNNQDKANYPLDSEVEEKSMEILLPLMADNSADFLTINKESWQNTADWLLKMGIITKAADIDALVTDIPQ